MTSEEVKQIIADSKFDPALKQRLLLLLPRLEKYTLSGLGKEVSRGDSAIIGEYLTSLWESFANLFDGLKNRDVSASENLSKFLAAKLSAFNGEDELYVLNFVLDLRTEANSGQIKLTTEQYGQLLDFEIKLYWELPKDEILFLFHDNLLFLLQNINLLQDTEVVVYNNQWDFEENFNKPFLEALYQNKEILGNKPVGTWVQEYFNFSSPSSFRSDVVQVAEFLTKNEEVKKLNDAAKKNLSEILKLYVWFLGSELNGDEIVAYKIQVQDQEAEQRDAMLLNMFSGQNSLPNRPAKPPVIPSPRNAPVMMSMDEVQAVERPEQEEAEVEPSGPAAVRPSTINLGARPKGVNIQDILKSRYEQAEGQHSGLSMGGGRPQENKSSVISSAMATKPAAAAPPEKSQKQLKQEEIDRKLDDLEKRVKN